MLTKSSRIALVALGCVVAVVLTVVLGVVFVNAAHQSNLRAEGLPPAAEAATGGEVKKVTSQRLNIGDPFKIGPLRFREGWFFAGTSIQGLTVQRAAKANRPPSQTYTFITFDVFKGEKHLGNVMCGSYEPIKDGPPVQMFCPPTPAPIGKGTSLWVTETSLPLALPGALGS